MRSFGVLLAPLRPKLRGAALPSVEEWPLRRLTVTSVPQMKNFLGCTFKTTVVDTGALEEDAPAVLMLHDVPGSHRDLGSLIGSFQRHGARVIAVNLPGNAFCKGNSPQDDITFSYNASDLASFADSVLVELDVRRLSGVIACGFSCLLALHLLNSVSHLYRAACLLGPPPLPPRSPLPPLLSSSFGFLWGSSSMTRSFSRLLLRSLGINRRLASPVSSPDEAAYAILTLQNAGSEEEVADLLEMTSFDLNSLPLLLISSSNGVAGCDQLFDPTARVKTLEESDAEDNWPRWVRLEAACRPVQLTRESFFTDKIAAIFLKHFAKDERIRKLGDV